VDERQPEWMAQHGYPFVERRPDVRCWRWRWRPFWFGHPWAVVRWLPVSRRELYLCACERWVMLGASDTEPSTGPVRRW
jgi:hypothetical protein